MKKLNHSGFAITGILYTLFILFILIAMAILMGLRSKNQMLQKSTEKLEKSYNGSDVSDDPNIGINASITERKALVKGKYIFELSSNEIIINCTTYLNKGTEFSKDNLIFTQEACNNYTYQFSFEEPSEKIKMSLVKIYSFEGDY